MKLPRPEQVLIGLLMVTLVLSIVTQFSISSLREKVEEHMTNGEQPPPASPQTYETTYTDAGGLTHTITTPKNPGESDEDHAARHKSAVDALLVKFPK